MKKFIKFVALSFTTLCLVFAVTALPASAQIDPFGACSGVSQSDVCSEAGGSDKLFGPGSIWSNILNTLTFVVGGIAVLMIIIGALRYVLSGGDQGNITSAKNTIIYALVALIVAVMANAIVNFVLTAI